MYFYFWFIFVSIFGKSFVSSVSSTSFFYLEDAAKHYVKELVKVDDLVQVIAKVNDTEGKINDIEAEFGPAVKVVLYYSYWCPHCKTFSIVYKDLSKAWTSSDRVQFYAFECYGNEEKDSRNGTDYTTHTIIRPSDACLLENIKHYPTILIYISKAKDGLTFSSNEQQNSKDKHLYDETTYTRIKMINNDSISLLSQQLIKHLKAFNIKVDYEPYIFEAVFLKMLANKPDENQNKNDDNINDTKPVLDKKKDTLKLRADEIVSKISFVHKFRWTQNVVSDYSSIGFCPNDQLYNAIVALYVLLNSWVPVEYNKIALIKLYNLLRFSMQLLPGGEIYQEQYKPLSQEDKKIVSEFLGSHRKIIKGNKQGIKVDSKSYLRRVLETPWYIEQDPIYFNLSEANITFNPLSDFLDIEQKSSLAQLYTAIDRAVEFPRVTLLLIYLNLCVQDSTYWNLVYYQHMIEYININNIEMFRSDETPRLIGTSNVASGLWSLFHIFTVSLYQRQHQLRAFDILSEETIISKQCVNSKNTSESMSVLKNQYEKKNVFVLIGAENENGFVRNKLNSKKKILSLEGLLLNPQNVMQVIYDTVETFFACEHCRRAFIHSYKACVAHRCEWIPGNIRQLQNEERSIDALTTTLQKKDTLQSESSIDNAIKDPYTGLVLWLFEYHNIITLRIEAESTVTRISSAMQELAEKSDDGTTADVALYLNLHFPPVWLCSSCYKSQEKILLKDDVGSSAETLENYEKMIFLNMTKEVYNFRRNQVIDDTSLFSTSFDLMSINFFPYYNVPELMKFLLAYYWRKDWVLLNSEDNLESHTNYSIQEATAYKIAKNNKSLFDDVEKYQQNSVKQHALVVSSAEQHY